MDFLLLVQELHRESGSGGTAPTSLVDLRGENLRLKNWISRAYLEILEKHSDWKFMWQQYEMAIVESTSSYSPLLAGGFSLSPDSLIAEYDRDAFFMDDQKINVVNYIDVKELARPTDEGIPSQVVIMPDDSLRLDPTPNAAGLLKFDYWQSATPLINNGDEPVFPNRFHYAIVGKALIFYATYENAPDSLQQGQLMYGEWMTKMESDQLPGDRHMHAKAEGNDMVIEVE